MKRKSKQGFTMVELVVVLVILSILAAIAVPFFINYWRRAEFRKNEENAKTIYLAAESKLTYYRASGQWESFKKQVEKKGIPYAGTDEKLQDRIYAVTLDADSYDSKNADKNPVLTLVDDYLVEKEIYKGAIAIEIDIESGEVYSAFYATKCETLNYDKKDGDHSLTMCDREYESRSKRLLGYYSAEDTVNTVSLKAKKLRIATISLQNSEKLSLNWSSNIGNSQDVSYEINFYEKESKKAASDKLLFSMVVSPYDLRRNGWSVTDGSGTGTMARITLKDASGKEKGEWDFPLSYSDNKYSLVLDAMMSAKTQALLGAQNASDRAEYEKTLSTSICRLKSVAADLASAQNIYAKVKATSYAGKDKKNLITQEYKDSEVASSNTANSMYADGTEGTDLKIAAFRHLSNIRYYQDGGQTGNPAFTLTSKNMDWLSAGTGLYDLTREPSGTQDILKLSWKENSKTDFVDFPTIEKLPSGYTLKGEGEQTKISNLRLGADSVIDDTTVNELRTAYGNTAATTPVYLGLFGEVEGTIQKMTLQNAQLSLTEAVKTGREYRTLQGVGILAGRSSGVLSDIAITGKDTKEDVSLKEIKAADLSQDAAVGGIVGILANKDGSALTKGEARNLSMSGVIRAEIPDAIADTSVRGIGGIVGYAGLSSENAGVRIDSCENHADINGNMTCGGIAGNVKGQLTGAGSLLDDELEANANIRDSSNDGLILCTTRTTGQMEGKYFGGVAGYGSQAVIYASTSAAGKSGYQFEANEKENLLLGEYVGGIIGYGSSTLLTNCSTQSGGYVLGSTYVGGIAGGLGSSSQAIRTTGGVSVTTNGNYVIGNNYVGGIVGENRSQVELKDCINNGIAAGYEKYVGGIVGYNANGATIANCASYLSDYDNSIYNRIVYDWQTTADYVGGIAGYNDGAIAFDAESQNIMVKSVSSIIVGKDYVGGVVGFNDQNATLDVAYTLIGGRIYGFGKCVGGGIGLNASIEVAKSSLRIRPRSVEGEIFVGGCIGANLLDLSEDTTISGIYADNILGNIKAKAFCGGVIGYQATYTAMQAGLGTAGTLIGKADRVLPVLENNIPVYQGKTPNTNQSTLTITTNNANQVINNIPISAGIYAGGVVGYCEKNSHVIIRDCKNTGNLTLAADVFGENEETVKLGEFVRSEIGNVTLPEEARELELHFVGGITGVNLENQIIERCTNTGSLSGFTGIGGVVGLNAGLVSECRIEEHFGNAALSYVGGIAGLNIGENISHNYKNETYTEGTIRQCSTAAGKTIVGNENLGGIVGWNLTDGVIESNTNHANISGTGDNVGGIAGRNSGVIKIGADRENRTQSILSTRGRNVGGVTGSNEMTGTLIVSGNAGTTGEISVVGTGTSIIGYENVGGIVGNDKNTQTILGGSKGSLLTSAAKLVRASHQMAGGIAGTTNGNIAYAVNRAAKVTADSGAAGGITAVNKKGSSITDCADYGDVSSNSGYAGGIAAENQGTIRNCVVQGTSSRQTEIYSLNVPYTGAICATNSGTVEESKSADHVTLRGSAVNIGGITGLNTGMIQNTTLTQMPTIQVQSSALVVGGAVGLNQGSVSGITAGTKQKQLNFENFSGYRYLGGIVGCNGTASLQNQNEEQAVARVTDSSYAGKMTEKSSEAGNCYGGIAGINYAVLENDQVTYIEMSVKGVYSATSASTAEQKEKLSSHAGGITGKNETDGKIEGCTIEDTKESILQADSGMLGGITGFNKGAIILSGSDKTKNILGGDVENLTLDDLNEKARENEISEDGSAKYVNYDKWLNEKKYNDNSSITDGRLKMYMNANGNLGGITAFNATSGSLEKCVSGNWFLLNRSQALGVGTGGMIGMNESEKDAAYLINGAFVGRELAAETDDRFAGGIIGNQNNSTSDDWTIKDCINYGTIYCYNTHYSGGIMGQWTGTGGTIESCRNYGNLQTTHPAGWTGASGGIVAQLYHPYEKNTYNIISSSNYGSIYKKAGTSGNGANDSAGILGNITTYTTANVSRGQAFTVQILDCVNEPGVNIYSTSMASGIFGFLSCDVSSDSKGGGEIQTSTQNVVLRIERCRNFGNILNGNNFTTGIFGDRYSKSNEAGDSWSKNTIVKDCYSFNLPNNYNQKDYPIYSAASDYTKNGRPSAMQPENRIHNYYLEGASGTGASPFTNVRISKDTAGTGQVTNSLSEGGKQSYGRGDRVYFNTYSYGYFFLYDMDKGQYFAAYIYPRTTVNGATCRLDGRYIKENGTVRGEVLFYLDKGVTPSSSDILNNYVKIPDNELVKNSRTSYKRLEGIVTDAGEEKILAPILAKATVAGGQISMEITPDDLPDSLTGEKCDPFEYIVSITDENNKTVEHKMYTEKEEFDIPAQMTGELKIQVRAKSMFDDVRESESIAAEVVQTKKILPAPDLRAELIDTTGNGVYTYRYSLNNLEDYRDYPGWKVEIRLFGYNNTLTLNEKNPTGTIDISYAENWYQINAQASGADYQSSTLTSVPVYLPNYKPQIKVGTDNSKDRVKVTTAVSGSSLDDLKIDVSLVGTNTDIVTTPTIYRAELVGTWKDGGTEKKNVVFAQTDMLSVSKGNAVATFTNLPDYLRNASDLKIRLWYSQSGLGPVYTSYDVDLESEANVTELTDVTEQEDGTLRCDWSYSYSTVLANKNGYFNDYLYTSSANLFTWLPAPKLDQEDGASLTPTYDEENRMQYTFSWDSKISATQAEAYKNAKYKIEMTGIDADNKEVTIDTGSYSDTSKSFVIDGDDWNYSKIRLKVTRLGSGDKIGLSTTATYRVAQRLERPGQPSVTNIDENELNYKISWSKISDETYCAGYQAYVREYNPTGSLKAAKAIGSTIKSGTDKNGVYEETVDLEEYAGSKIIIYLVAKSKDEKVFVDSAPGISYELEIPQRLSAPVIDQWTKSWTHDKNLPVDAEDFREGTSKGLRVGIASNIGSIPPGGSAYLLKAYVYDSAADAKAATDTDPGANAVKIYPQTYADSLIPVQMDMQNAQNYYHFMTDFSIRYAGKWIVFYTRISSGDGYVSSKWVKAPEAFQLPFVRLDAPDVRSDKEEQEDTVSVNTNPDMPSRNVKWNAEHTVLSWDSVDCAEVYLIDLTGEVKAAEGQTTAKAITGNLRVIETTEKVDGKEKKKVVLQQYVQREVTNDRQEKEWKWIWENVEEIKDDSQDEIPEEERTHTFRPEVYSVTVKSNYTVDQTICSYEYVLSTEIVAVPDQNGGFHYTLKLPDVTSVQDQDNHSVVHDNFNITKKAVLKADVLENINAQTTGKGSEAYVPSDSVEIKWN